MSREKTVKLEDNEEEKETLSLETKQKESAKHSKNRFKPRPYSTDILEQYSFKYDKFKRLWIYDSHKNIWKDTAQLDINSILRKGILGDDDLKRYCVAEIIADLQGLTYTGEGISEPPAHLIPFNNGIYDLEKEELLDYSPQFFFINKLAVNIDEQNQECPTIDKIFRQLVNSRDIDTLYEILGYTFYRKYPYPKVFILYGSGGNGKTTYVKILSEVIGIENISLVGANDLQFNRFASSQLFGKMINVSGEMDYAMLKNTSQIKQCCGEDLIHCERKFKEPFPFRNYAKMVFQTNQVPLTLDKTFGFYRRVFLLEFPFRFTVGKNADPMIVRSIPKEEFEGLAWKCLQRLKQIRKKGFMFTRHEATEKVTKRYEELSNPLVVFLGDHTKEDPNGNIAVRQFSDRLSSHLREKRLRLWGSREINKAMKEEGYYQNTVSEKTGKGKSHVYKAWCGLRWKDMC